MFNPPARVASMPSIKLSNKVIIRKMTGKMARRTKWSGASFHPLDRFIKIDFNESFYRPLFLTGQNFHPDPFLNRSFYGLLIFNLILIDGVDSTLAGYWFLT